MTDDPFVDTLIVIIIVLLLILFITWNDDRGAYL